MDGRPDETAQSTTPPEQGEGREPDVGRRGRGRPRDPHLDERALSATLEVFVERGWAGLSIEEVASRARVGKSSIYLRWASKAALLAAALSDPAMPEGGDEDEVDGTPIRDYLVTHATRRAHWYMEGQGLAVLRFFLEARAFPEELADVRQQAVTGFVLAERHRVERAIRAGELLPSASPVHILDAIEGAVLMHLVVTPPELMPRVRAGLGKYIETLVDLQIGPLLVR